MKEPEEYLDTPEDDVEKSPAEEGRSCLANIKEGLMSFMDGAKQDKDAAFDAVAGELAGGLAIATAINYLPLNEMGLGASLIAAGVSLASFGIYRGIGILKEGAEHREFTAAFEAKRNATE